MNYYNSDSIPFLHIVVYSLNQKGRSEPVLFENVPIIEADKRTGEFGFHFREKCEGCFCSLRTFKENCFVQFMDGLD